MLGPVVDQLNTVVPEMLCLETSVEILVIYMRRFENVQCKICPVSVSDDKRRKEKRNMSTV